MTQSGTLLRDFGATQQGQRAAMPTFSGLIGGPSVTGTTDALRSRCLHEPERALYRPDRSQTEQRGGVLSADRLAEVIALAILAASGQEKFCVALGLDALGNSLNAKLMRQANGRAYNGRAACI